MKSIITVKEARKILGKKYDDMSDEQIERTISLLHSIAKQYIENEARRSTQEIIP